MRHLEKIEGWVRTRYAVNAAQIVLVNEERGRLPGLPDWMTTILFWGEDGTRYRVQIFKPAADVTEADLPVSWVRSALADQGEPDCC